MFDVKMGLFFIATSANPLHYSTKGTFGKTSHYWGFTDASELLIELSKLTPAARNDAKLSVARSKNENFSNVSSDRLLTPVSTKRALGKKKSRRTRNTKVGLGSKKNGLKWHYIKIRFYSTEEWFQNGSAHEKCESYLISAMRRHWLELYIVRPTQVCESRTKFKLRWGGM